jgi:hypothetical protein
LSCFIISSVSAFQIFKLSAWFTLSHWNAYLHMCSNPSEYSSYNGWDIRNILFFCYLWTFSDSFISRYHFTCWPFLLNDYNLKRTKHTCSEPNLLKHLYHKREFKATNTPVWWHSSSDVDGHEWIIMFIINLKLMSWNFKASRCTYHLIVQQERPTSKMISFWLPLWYLQTFLTVLYRYLVYNIFPE